MIRIHPYLTFGGNCREAMRFYQACLGGKLELQTVGSSPLSDKMPPQMQESILHATLIHKDLVIQASDMAPQQGIINGNSVSLSLTCESEEHLRRCYQKLAKGGSQNHPPEDTFRGAVLGELTDKYGHHWLLTFTKHNKHEKD